MPVKKMVKKSTENQRSTKFAKGNKIGHRFAKGNKDSVGKGRPKKIPALDKMLDDILGTDESDDKSAMYKIIQALAKRARYGDHKAATLLMNRKWGLAKQYIEVDTISRKDTADLFPAAPPSKK